MKQIRPYPKVKISKKAGHSVKEGHPWIYGEEILEMGRQHTKRLISGRV